MLGLKYQDSLDLNNWGQMIYLGYIVCVFLTVLGEIVTVTYTYGWPDGNNASQWRQFVVHPAGFYVLVLFFTFCALKFCERLRLVAWQAYIDVTCVCVIVSYIGFVHYNDAVIYIVFVFPILAALFFIDIKPVIYAFALTQVCYFSIVIYFLPQAGHAPLAHGFIEIVTVSFFLTACFGMALTLLYMLSALAENILKQQKELKQDSFTTLLNHTSFYGHLSEMLRQDGLSGLVMILWDIDDFKKVNDRYGHDMGDQIILAFADSMRECLHPDECGFRFGGEEFCTLTRRSADEAMQLATDVRSAFSAKAKLVLAEEPLTACAGVCVFSKADFGTEQEFFVATDSALYHAKHTPGKNTTCLWTPDISHKMRLRRKTDLA
ncbi:MAG: GGDEF domain-containing protein [Azoarcus sp.]|jgi:diguanylate cyclase (GGDEF)-like protein|nr:GGDEF domain-containing protein [Azoarcus sp.]